MMTANTEAALPRRADKGHKKSPIREDRASKLRVVES